MKKDFNMMDSVLAHAKDVLMSGGDYMYALHALNEDGHLYVLFCPYRDRQEKHRLYQTLRLWNLAKGVDHYVVCSEAWMVKSVDGDRSKLPDDLADAEGRIETLICCEVKYNADNRRVGKMKSFEIKRNAEGKVVDLVPMMEKDEDPGHYSGDLFDFIPPKRPPATAKEQASEVLAIGRKLGFVPKMEPVLIPIKGGKS